MPPSGDRLTPAQIAAIRSWIDNGARWPDALANEGGEKKHWAFTPPTRPALPAVRANAFLRNPLDRFVLARLEKEQIRPSPEADRVTLLRRL